MVAYKAAVGIRRKSPHVFSGNGVTGIRHRDMRVPAGCWLQCLLGTLGVVNVADNEEDA